MDNSVIWEMRQPTTFQSSCDLICLQSPKFFSAQAGQLYFKIMEEK